MLKALLMIGIGATLAACGPDCVSMCEDAQADGECFVKYESGNVGNRTDVNCERYCENLESVMRNEQCVEHLEEMVECVDEAENACHALRDSCEFEYTDVFGCTEYCEDGAGEDRADCKFVYAVDMTTEPPS